jgi:hypothetical protein
MSTFTSGAAFPGGVPGIPLNAFVSNDAPLQPPQAFVNAMTEIWAHNAETFIAGRPFASKAITTVDATRFGYLMKWIAGPLRAFGYGDDIDFSGNALNQASVDAVLAGCKLAVDEPLLGTSIPMNLDLSGGTNAAPSAQGLSDANYLINTGGWTVTTN